MTSIDINASIITIGDELLIGQTIDTNSAFIAQELNRIGIWMRRRTAVGDVREEIWHALEEEGSRSQLVIITGGLGPTADDITKPLLADYFGGRLVVNEHVRKHVIYLFEHIYRRPGPILERNLRQAEVPDNCEVLHNARGSAPGMLFRKNGTIYISLPGVPHEMKGIMTDEVVPLLLRELRMPAVVHRTAFTAGQGESMIAERLMEFESKLPAYIKLAYLPSYGMVKLRLTSRRTSRLETEKEVDEWFSLLQEEVREYLVSNQDEGMEIVVGKLLQRTGTTLGTTESCTGGYIAHLLTSIAGSSAWYKGSVIAYANAVKEDILSVQSETLATVGAVSEQTVREMVAGGLRKLKTDYVLATSGIMGPGAGSEEKPVGTVWVAVGNRQRTETIQLHLRFDRARNISLATLQALNFLRKFILAEADGKNTG